MNDIQTTSQGAQVQRAEAFETATPPIFERVEGLPVRHLARWLLRWDELRATGTASERVEARYQIRRLARALGNAADTLAE